MFLKRSTEQIISTAVQSISENTPITNFNAGSIARSIVEAIAPEIGTSNQTDRLSLYDVAQQVLDNGFLSKAKNEWLDLIGGLFSYKRRTEQVRDANGILVEQPISDDQYRYEISQIVPSMATANYTAIRLVLLTIQGVADVIPQEYSHGTGSFSFLAIPMYGFDEEEILAEMEQKIQNTKAFGIRPHVFLPTKIPVDLTVQLAFHETTAATQKQNIKLLAQKKITDYIGLHEVGQGFIYNDLVQEIMNVHNEIRDFEIIKCSINNEPVLLTNHDILEDERLIPQLITVQV